MVKKKYMPQAIFNGCVIIAVEHSKDNFKEAIVSLVAKYQTDYPNDIDLKNDIMKAAIFVRDQIIIEPQDEIFERLQTLNEMVDFNGAKRKKSLRPEREYQHQRVENCLKDIQHYYKSTKLNSVATSIQNLEQLSRSAPNPEKTHANQSTKQNGILAALKWLGFALLVYFLISQWVVRVFRWLFSAGVFGG